MHKEDTTVLVTLRDTFEGATLTSLEWKGRPCWVAGEIDRALGLPTKLVGSRWAYRSKDYREGADGEQITGAALDALKAAGLVEPNAPSATVFYESGATLYLMASRAEKARAFRWHLVDEVLPKVRKLAAPIPEPQKLLAGPGDLMKEALRLDHDILSKSCGGAWLRDQARTADAHARIAKAQREEEWRRGIAADKRIMREERAAAKLRRARPVKTTLW